MIARFQVYKCEVCGNMTEVLQVGGGTMVCCGRNMTQITENTVDASKEKHVPVVERIPEGIRVKVGSVAHPMEEKHYIQWIEVIVDGVRMCHQFLAPGMAPEAVFPVKFEHFTVREYCNLHGLWKVDV